MEKLSRKLGTVSYDNLFAGNIPEKQTAAGTLRKGSAETEFKRGTLLAKSSADGLLVILGTETAAAESGKAAEVLEPYGVLCDDVTVGTTDNEPCVIYTQGKFNTNALIVADDYTITEADKDTLRKYNIILSAAIF